MVPRAGTAAERAGATGAGAFSSSNRSDLMENLSTPRIAVSNAPGKPFLSAHWPGQVVFELGSGKVVDF
jgi:hypothetical protein